MQTFQQQKLSTAFPRKDPQQAALVLEGGAMRTIYTAGVLDIMMENGLDLAYVIGTSSGSLTGANYASWQAGRTAHITINYCHESEYISLLNRFRHDSVFNLDFIFGNPNGRWPAFDEQTYMDPRRRFVVVATSCDTGSAVYFDKPSPADLPACLKASCAIPVFSKMIATPRGKCLDGGMADSIPFAKAMADGYEKIIVVKTRSSSYRKKPTPRLAASIYQRFYEEYPQFLEALNNRPDHYNSQIEELYRLQKQGKVFIIEPQAPITIGRAERNKSKLRALYEQGRAESMAILPQIREYLQN